MKYKKGQEDAIGIILILIIVTIVLSICYALSGCDEAFEEYENNQINKCSTDCSKVNKYYFRYDSGSHSSNECWCRDIENNVVQIW